MATDIEVIGHVVEDPRSWIARVLTQPDGASRVAAKVARWLSAYLAEKDLPGYQTRAEREQAKRDTAAAEQAARQAEVDRQNDIKTASQAHANYQSILGATPDEVLVFVGTLQNQNDIKAALELLLLDLASRLR